MQTGRLGIAAQLPLADVLTGELENFRAKMTLSGHDNYSAGADWCGVNPDDLGFEVAMACWFGELGGGDAPIIHELAGALANWLSQF